jgi:lysophospholipase L1-like esterase
MCKVKFLAIAIPFILILISFDNVNSQQLSYPVKSGGYDTARIYKAMAKARRGEPITIAVIGGSITVGYAASSVATRWANLMQDWWITNFPNSTVTLVNAGISGTGSDQGVFRLKDDVLSYNPDFIVVEFAVNDGQSYFTSETMEGLIRQSLVAPGTPGVMMLILKQENGATALASHKPVAVYYGVPFIDYADSIDAQVARDGITLHTIYSDGIHPLDAGMKYIADFITKELSTIKGNLPPDSLLPSINATLPAALFSDVFSHTYRYTSVNLIPSSNTGWKTSGTDWTSDVVGSQMNLTVEGNAVSIIYMQSNIASYGQAEFWVDNGPHKIVDGYWTANWTSTSFALIQENLANGKHILHCKIAGTNSAGSTGHFFDIHYILKAGHLTNQAPIAFAGNPVKTIAGTSISLDGSKSFDPDKNKIFYHWTVLQRPLGSIALIADSTSVLASFIPDIGGNYKIGLIVSDSLDASVTSIKSLTIRNSNTIPIANAGNDTTVLVKKLIPLNGNGSSDPDGDTLSYSWRIIDQPYYSTSVLYYPLSSNPELRPNPTGIYHIGLTVSDGYASSAEDTVTIKVVTVITGIPNFDSEDLFTLYPNPASREINLKFYLKEPSPVSIALYSITGQLVCGLFNNTKPAGFFDEQFILPMGLTSGMYLLRLKTLDYNVNRMMVVK